MVLTLNQKMNQLIKLSLTTIKEQILHCIHYRDQLLLLLIQ